MLGSDNYLAACLAVLLVACISCTSFADTLDVPTIWVVGDAPAGGSLHAGFRRAFDLADAPLSASLRIFAYTRYALFINGAYVARGPNRFELERPEFDAFDVTSLLRPGRNVIAVLVHRDQPSGRVRQHAPGLQVALDVTGGNGSTRIETDGSWHAFDEPTYGPQRAVWSSFAEARDARRLAGDWVEPAFDASTLPMATNVDVSDAARWPAPRPRTIPLLRETTLSWTARMTGPVSANASAFTVAPGATLALQLPRIAQAYYAMEIEAAAGVTVTATPLLPEGVTGTPSTYVTRAGRQRWIGQDTWGMSGLAITAADGPAVVRDVRLVEVAYPFDRVGRFASGDPLLDRIWDVATRGVQLMSEDAYVDCADRERVEWMDDDPPAYDVTRVAFAGPCASGGPGGKGTAVYSDPRLFKNLLLRVALTQRADGMVKAHTCSERWDLHAIMEDRACDWVEGLRKYDEATGDDALVRELWPRVERLTGWFLDRRTPRGLVLAREWVAWDNPLAYATCEGAANNAFVYRALRDAAFLAGRIGRDGDARRLGDAADALATAFDRALWIESEGAYGAAAGTPEVKPQDQMFKKSIDLKTIDGRVVPTLHANLYALDRGIVPPERRARVIAWTRAHDAQIKQIMANHFYFKLLYATDESGADQLVLDRIRAGWRGMAESPWQTTWEGDDDVGSKAHIYGAVPAYTLSTYVLGVRRDAPVWERTLVIEPHLADLAHAGGTVCTEFGPVEVSWERGAGCTTFELTVPEGVTAELRLPGGPAGRVVVDDAPATTRAEGRRRVLTVGAGKHAGVSE